MAIIGDQEVHKGTSLEGDIVEKFADAKISSNLDGHQHENGNIFMFHADIPEDFSRRECPDVDFNIMETKLVSGQRSQKSL